MLKIQQCCEISKKKNGEAERETSGETIDDGREVVLALESLLSSEIEIANHRREHRRQAFGQHVGALSEVIVAVGTVGTGRLRRFEYDAVVFRCFHCRLVQFGAQKEVML